MESSNKLVWFPDSQHGYCIGRIVDIAQDRVSVEPLAAPRQLGAGYAELEAQSRKQSLDFPYATVFPADQLELEILLELDKKASGARNCVDVDDNCALIHLNEAALLENVRVRFYRDKIYTYVAHILIAVNPYFEIKGLHSPETIKRYEGKSLGTLPPHVYAIADKAYRDMKAFRQSQSIIINGESGAGKTESQKYVLRYLCLSGSQSGRLEKLILDESLISKPPHLTSIQSKTKANPLLEAFGNAKTIRNNNSSRFGKFIEIHYSSKFTVTGGLFLHYLLEKSRICTQSAGERNYHIFYQLCACLPDEQWNELQLGPPDAFRYLAGGCTQYFCAPNSEQLTRDQVRAERKSRAHLAKGAIQDPLTDDLRCYEQTDRALNNFGVSEQEKRRIYSIVAAVLHLGNVSFCDDPDDNRGGCKLEPESGERALAITARLIGLEADLLRQSLISRIMSTARGGHKGTVYMVALSVQQAQAARDALAKAIYAKLFDHIVTKIVNRSIPFSSSAYYIGVLDVAGFEYFQRNSFEQFLINFCNERLQQFFNERILKEEQSIYEKEGLQLRKVQFTDNSDCIQLFEARSTGIFDLLDEESRLPKPNAEHFTQSVHAANRGHFRLAVARASKLRQHREIRDDEGFLIRHFAGAVCYQTGAFIDKNNDALHASLKSLMLEADNPLLRELFSASCEQVAPAQGQPGQAQQQQQQQPPVNFWAGPASQPQVSNKLNFVSVASTFRSQLAELMGKLRATGSHFIRCIKPNSDMVAHKFEGSQILSQLHCSGMDSVLELMQQGYPSRASFNDLYASYKRLLPDKLARLDSHLFCRALFKVVGLSDNDFRFGSSKVFFRPGKFAQFDQIIRSDGEHVAQLVGKVSRWLVCARWRKLQFTCLSAIKLHRKILYRRQMIVSLQKNWRLALVASRLRFRLASLRRAREICSSLLDFESIAGNQLKPLSASERSLVEEQTARLKEELELFMGEMKLEIQRTFIAETNNNTANRKRDNLAEAKLRCQTQLDKLATKRDLLVRSIKDRLAKQAELIELERRVGEENRRREQAELEKRREESIKRQRSELEQRRRLELAKVNNGGHLGETISHRQGGKEEEERRRQQQQLVDSATDPMEEQALEQERRDYEIALKLARESGAPATAAKVLPPSENHSKQQTLNKFDLSKWKYSDLRDTINTSCDLELLEACKREFHRRLKVYHAWRALNSRPSQPDLGMRAPSSVLLEASQQQAAPISAHLPEDRTAGQQQVKRQQPQQQQQQAQVNEQRYFRIPFVRQTGATAGASNGGQRGWWFAHFDGQWIARQLELHPGREPILLIAGKHDIEMCELSLRETRLTSKRGAEILPQEFEEEWAKHGGKAYARAHLANESTGSCSSGTR